ncbi:GGDEF domain-containing protein [Tissierella sp.]|uniref:GGDEF domain-containing protein n=1 Tax=Tissierella sp. TaxID=41274 RepID=UPI002862E383|nr:GGDEF domain-containing protein [Tissierella sp.]MDR7857385.1 GGDEF domain-containing protein [Tissierella sp.]
MKTRFKSIFSLFLPFALIIFAYVFFTKTNTMSEAQLDIIRFSPYGIFIVGLAIAFKFNRSREFFVIIVLSLCLISIDYIQSPLTTTVEVSHIYAIISLAIPMNIAIFAFLKERGILSLWGIIRIVFIISQLFFALWLIYSGEINISNLINGRIILVNEDSLNQISQISIFLFLITFIILVIRQAMKNNSQEVSFIAVLGALFYMIYSNNPMIYSIFFTISGIILIISIIQDSYYMAFTDELTGLPSRRALKQDMMKLGVNYSIAMLDIDHFKKFNDTYGHDIGDEVLRLVASIIRDVNGGGRSYRYGGEEFTILFSGRGIKEVLPHIEELREKIEKRGFIVRSKNRPKNKPKNKSKSSKSGKQVKITVSIGVSQKNEKDKVPEDVLKSADKALYRAKKKGRNMVSK